MPATINEPLFVKATLTGPRIGSVEPWLVYGGAEITTEPGSDPAKIAAKSVPGFGKEECNAGAAAGRQGARGPPAWMPEQPENAAMATTIRTAAHELFSNSSYGRRGFEPPADNSGRPLRRPCRCLGTAPIAF